MHYVKQFNINGIDTKQIACIELQGRPNAATEGAVGVLGIDMLSPTHEVYKCVAVNGSIYTWEILSAGMSIISATITGEGGMTKSFPYDKLLVPDNYLFKSGDLILDSEGYLYQITAIGAEFCESKYCGTQIGGIASGDKNYSLRIQNGKLQLVTESGAVISEFDFVTNPVKKSGDAMTGSLSVNCSYPVVGAKDTTSNRSTRLIAYPNGAGRMENFKDQNNYTGIDISPEDDDFSDVAKVVQMRDGKWTSSLLYGEHNIGRFRIPSRLPFRSDNANIKCGGEIYRAFSSDETGCGMNLTSTGDYTNDNAPRATIKIFHSESLLNKDRAKLAFSEVKDGERSVKWYSIYGEHYFPSATSSTKGGVKSGGDISVDSDGKVTVTHITPKVVQTLTSISASGSPISVKRGKTYILSLGYTINSKKRYDTSTVYIPDDIAVGDSVTSTCCFGGNVFRIVYNGDDVNSTIETWGLDEDKDTALNYPLTIREI